MDVRMNIKQKTLDPTGFDYVSGNAKQFPYEEPREGDTKIFYFDRDITSEEAITEMQKEGYEPMLASELLEYAKDGWNGSDYVVALGTTWLDPSGRRHVLVLGEWRRERYVYCYWFDRRWRRYYRFAARRPRKSTENSVAESSTSDALTLVSEIEERLARLKKIV